MRPLALTALLALGSLAACGSGTDPASATGQSIPHRGCTGDGERQGLGIAS